MQIKRHSVRTKVEIPVTITTVLDSMEASIADLSENGALIIGVELSPGTRLHIEYLDQTIFAQSRWSEIDRIGVRFLFPMAEGPLYDRLMMARATLSVEQLATHGKSRHPHPPRHHERSHALDRRVGHLPGHFGRAPNLD